MFLVGLTGGIATGKSFVASIFRSKGIEIIDADLIAREVVEPRKVAWRKIQREFGDGVFNGDGTLNRQALGQIVFSDPEKRHKLNSITHPEIYKSILRKCIKLFFSGHQFAVIDLPLLFESGKMVKYLHKTVVVAVEPSVQLRRLMDRDNLSESDALARINAQMPLEEKIRRADYVIRSHEDREETKQQVEQLIGQLRSLKTHWKYRFLVFTCCAIPVSLLGFGLYKLFIVLR